MENGWTDPAEKYVIEEQRREKREREADIVYDRSKDEKAERRIIIDMIEKLGDQFRERTDRDLVDDLVRILRIPRIKMRTKKSTLSDTIP